ncbi:hypothetical protein [Nevskia soli]|uniref:hypothetical protein n=1 Tax=Nevskia soli TaxID=418856 RepID=UPI0015D95FDB|nr:hypothetical protein [Nevskia soli]
MSSISISLNGIEAAQDRFDGSAQRIAVKGELPQDSIELVNARNEIASDENAIQIAEQIAQSAIDLVG